VVRLSRLALLLAWPLAFRQRWLSIAPRSLPRARHASAHRGSHQSQGDRTARAAEDVLQPGLLDGGTGCCASWTTGAATTRSAAATAASTTGSASAGSRRRRW
jgi:hypothetical protein